MVSELVEYTIGELVKQEILEKPLDGNHGDIHPKGADFVESGIPFIMASDLINGEVDTTNCKFITLEQANSLRKGFSKEGDVLLSHKATIGRTAIVNAINTDFIILTPQVTYYRVKNKNRLNNRYLKYYFDSWQFQSVLQQWAGGGSTRAYIGITAQSKLPIILPPFPEQKRIAHILGTLDDKIELNRQTNQTLEAMAQALFKSWFVDFDPVIDNALEAGNLIPEPLQKRAEIRQALRNSGQAKPLPEETRTLFPARFVLSEEMGWVPEGWGVGVVGDFIELAYGKSLTAKSRVPGPYPVYGSGGISGYHNEFICEGSSIIVGRKGTVGSIYWEERNNFPIDTVFFVKLKEDFPLYWVYQVLLTLDIASLSADSAVPGVNRNSVYALSMINPTKLVLERYWKLVGSNVSKRTASDNLNASLSILRDTLLPKLISGELRIPEAEAQVKEAVA